jgi:cell division septation protein DedD
VAALTGTTPGEGGDVAATANGDEPAGDASPSDAPPGDVTTQAPAGDTSPPDAPTGDATTQAPAGDTPPPAETGTIARGGNDAGDSVESAIVVTDDLSPYSEQYCVHVSSFRSLEDARSDAYYLNDRGYPIIIASVDLGSKGKWFRVYVGPYTDRDAAATSKIRLDEMPRVKFTRITKL